MAPSLWGIDTDSNDPASATGTSDKRAAETKPRADGDTNLEAASLRRDGRPHAASTEAHGASLGLVEASSRDAGLSHHDERDAP